MSLRVGIALSQNNNLPQYLGSAWRGLIGWELKRLVCPFEHHQPCLRCVIKEHCPYFLLFEKNASLPGLQNAPRGYVFYPTLSDEKKRIELYIILFGNCTRFLPILAKALFEGQKTGLGAGRYPYEIIFWEKKLPGRRKHPLPLDPDGCHSSPFASTLKEWLENKPSTVEKLRIRLITPVRLRKKKKYLNTMDWSFFFATLARRLETINCIFNGGALMGKKLWIKMQHQFSAISGINSKLTWQEYQRYSNRQRQKILMGGLVGEVSVDSPAPWMLDWWMTAGLVHVGKGAAMGLGKLDFL